MKNFQQKRGFRNILYSRPVLVLLGILMLVFAFGVFDLMGKMSLTSENRKNAENKVLELKKNAEKLRLNIDKLSTDNGIEESIREKFGLAKEGEGLIVINENKNIPPTPKKIPSRFQTFFSNLFFWKNWFK